MEACDDGEESCAGDPAVDSVKAAADQLVASVTCAIAKKNS